MSKPFAMVRRSLLASLAAGAAFLLFSAGVARAATTFGPSSVSLDVNLGIGRTDKLSRLTVKPAADAADIGGTTMTSAATTIVGTGTTFLSSLGIGDRISLSSAAGTYATVTAIASDTSLTVSGALGNGTSQTINAKRSIFRLDDAASAVKLTVSDLGYLGLGTATPSEQLELTGNLRLPATTSTTGIIYSGANRFIHNFGTNNFFAGVNAGNLTMTGSGQNTGIGVNTFLSNTTGSNNTAIGMQALLFNTTGGQNTAGGWGSLSLNTSGANNTANGMQTLNSNTTGNNNTGMGMNALTLNSTGTGNTALGFQAGYTATPANANTTGTNNTFIGFNAGPGTASQLTNATAIGSKALVSSSNSLVLGGTGVDAVNVGIGTATPNEQLELTGNLRLPTTTATMGIIKSGANRFIHTFGTNNFFAGVNAGNLTMTGAENIGVGESALLVNTTGNNNIAIGRQALSSNTTGFSNTGSGWGSLRSNTTGRENTASGDGALDSNITGNANTGMGVIALFSNTTGTGNTALGYYAGYTGTAITTGSNNTFLGTNAGSTSAARTKGVAIGFNASVGCDNCMTLGGTGVDALNVGIGTTSPARNLHVVGSLGVGQDGANSLIELGDSVGGSGARGWMQWISASDYLQINSHNGTVYSPIALNPNGGNVGIGTATPGSKLDVAGDVTIGVGGTPITKHNSTTVASVSSASIPASSCADYATVSGINGIVAFVGNTVVASPIAAAGGIETVNLSWNAFVSATNTVNIRACNPTAGAIDTADTQTWRVDVWQH